MMVKYKHVRMNNQRNITEYVYSAECEKLHTTHSKAANNMTLTIGYTLPLNVGYTRQVTKADDC